MAPSADFAAISNGSATATNGLSPEQLEFWDKHGYLIIPDALSQDTVQSLLSETNKMLDEFSLDDHPMTKFTTGGDDGDDHVGDEYFLNSGDKVRFFFEEDAFSPTGQLLRPKHRSINKIGHSLHTLSPAFQRITLSPTNASIARGLGFRSPEVLQSMIICKQPSIGGRVPPHQDSTFLYTNPPSAVGFWYALEDADVGNGCLSFAAGSHRRAPIRSRFVRKVPYHRPGEANGNGVGDGEGKAVSGTEFISNEGAQYPLGLEEQVDDGTLDLKERYTLGEVKAGSLVLIHGNILHKSEKNTSERGRFIYTFHVIEGAEGWEYDRRNWLQVEGGFSKLE